MPIFLLKVVSLLCDTDSILYYQLHVTSPEMLDPSIQLYVGCTDKCNIDTLPIDYMPFADLNSFYLFQRSLHLLIQLLNQCSLQFECKVGEIWI